MIRLPAAIVTGAVFVLCLLLSLPRAAQAETIGAETIKLGVLKFGTVNWELTTIKSRGLDKAQGITLEVLGLASKNATSVALQSGAVDMIVTDWIWVSRQRAEGADFTFVPFSTAAGAVVVPAGSPIRTLGDLKGKRLGIAGGPLDKSWLLLRATARQEAGLDLDREVEKVFGAPPLLNQQLLAGRIDAVINFWHYVARLEAQGFRSVWPVEEMTKALEIESRIPLIGFVFRQAWAEKHGTALRALLEASFEAKEILRASDEAWLDLRPLMKAKDDATFHALRDGYRRGIPLGWGPKEQKDAERLFDLLATLGGRKLVGRSSQLQEGTFWPGFEF